MDLDELPLHEPERMGDERTMLLQFLGFYRQVLLRKAAGLSGEELSRTLAPSTLSLGALLKHMAVVEANWFVRRFEGHDYPEPWFSAPWEQDPDWDLTSAAHDEPEYLFELFRSAIVRSDEIVAATASLDQLSVRQRDGSPWSMRWILIHLIEEYARHCGHADLIRESIDGAVGD